ncbi:MAG: 50S ribosomal protein L6 [Pseudomonadota bacterium]|nr:50S ribosomal protein L6 [Alphaproteobacteria bacterium]MCS5598080.1 50S ribosomal protein L6 [Alphaproteobacteria bacterium]MEE3323078.1 50S ribosomal protein L6 [Pseudomonadota bacterium]|tara:strand:- start:653562 stop:654095 length:534 start_codon:yes stop_codon:yes gene_type:complete
MSRIGKNPVTIPEGVNVDISGQDVKVKGPKGELSLTVHDEVSAKLEDNVVVVSPRTGSRLARSLWATTRSLINNMCVGVKDGYEKKLEINGVGYRAAVQGKEVVLQLGFSHEVRHAIPQGITVQAEKPTLLVISGIDNQLVGETAAKIRAYRPPEPYKGKGVRYEGEYIMRKEGKKK